MENVSEHRGDKTSLAKQEEVSSQNSGHVEYFLVK
jgi:hypothetical protein